MPVVAPAGPQRKAHAGGTAEPRSTHHRLGGDQALVDRDELVAAVPPQAGHAVGTGGGPGAMEAANLGAFAGHGSRLDTALDRLPSSLTATVLHASEYSRIRLHPTTQAAASPMAA